MRALRKADRPSRCRLNERFHRGLPSSAADADAFFALSVQGSELPDIQPMLAQAGIAADRRPQTLTMEAWAALARAYAPHWGGGDTDADADLLEELDESEAVND